MTKRALRPITGVTLLHGGASPLYRVQIGVNTVRVVQREEDVFFCDYCEHRQGKGTSCRHGQAVRTFLHDQRTADPYPADSERLALVQQRLRDLHGYLSSLLTKTHPATSSVVQDALGATTYLIVCLEKIRTGSRKDDLHDS